MQRVELDELHYITPIENVPSICKRGILAHNAIQKLGLAHASVAAQEIQDIRKEVKVPGTARPLHDYANLYLCARNPMLLRRRAEHRDICVLKISCDVLDIPGAIVTDGNAASGHSRFQPAPDGLVIVNRDRTFARDWWDEFPPAFWKKKSQKCAEVLVPGSVPPKHMRGAYVSCDEAEGRFADLGIGLTTTLDPDLFFLT